jgi:hypothetical protein
MLLALDGIKVAYKNLITNKSPGANQYTPYDQDFKASNSFVNNFKPSEKG